MYTVNNNCILCGQHEDTHENFAKCLILIKNYLKNGALTERGRIRAAELKVKLSTNIEDERN